MSPIEPSKRRRLNTANNTLSQPFKSPFKSPLKQTPASTTSPSSSSPPPPPPPTNKAAPPSSSSSSSSPQTSHDQPTSQPPQSSTPLRNNTRLPPSTNNQYTPRTHHHNHTHNHLLTTLHSRLSTSRNHLDTATQALAIESSNGDLDLETLIRKWKGKSREAAEEVFEGVRGRVERMGGVRGLNGREGGWGWDERGMGRGDEEGRVGGERGGRGREDESRSGDEGDEGGEEEKGGEEGAYTMDMMLRSLGIDLAVIGFDRRLQKWVD